MDDRNRQDRAGETVGLYVHIAFCQRICFYCDFNTYAGQQRRIPSYVRALVSEISRSPHFPPSAPSPANLRIGSVFFGGGTPSLLSAGQVAEILDAAARRFTVVTDAEITLESNPNDLHLDYLRSIRDAGVNRLSIGVQSLDDRQLRRLGRRHNAAEALAAFEAARRAGFDNVSVDLMFALPGQDLASWQATVDRTCALGPEHLSLYQLTVEPGTPFAKWAAEGKLDLPDDDQAADMYEWTIERLDAAGFDHYEISNWARRDPGRDLRGQHNLRYWRNESYLGAGAGAHAALGGFRFLNELDPRRYVECVERGESPVVSHERIGRDRAMGETLMLGLRLAEGVRFDDFRRRFGEDLREVFGTTIAELESYALIDRTDERLRLTHRGKLLGNEVFQRFVAAAEDRGVAMPR